MTPFNDEWILVKDRIQEDFKRTRKDYKWIEPLLGSLALKEKRLSLLEAYEYLDECFCSYAEGLVLRLTKRKNTRVRLETREYFFEDLNKDDKNYCWDLKLESLDYDEEARNNLRFKLIQ